MNMKVAVQILIDHGATVRHKGGEIIIENIPGYDRPIVTSHWTRRKDASRLIEKVVRRLQ